MYIWKIKSEKKVNKTLPKRRGKYSSIKIDLEIYVSKKQKCSQNEVEWKLVCYLMYSWHLNVHWMRLVSLRVGFMHERLDKYVIKVACCFDEVEILDAFEAPASEWRQSH